MPKSIPARVAVDDAKPAWWSNDCWATPSAFVGQLAMLFLDQSDQSRIFQLDPCASRRTAKAPRFYTRRDDGLAQPWDAPAVFLNPPYSDVLPWVRKAHREVLKTKWAKIVVALLPLCTDTAWFHDHVLPYAELHYVRGRIAFLDWEGRPANQNRGPSLIAVYRPGYDISTSRYTSYSIPARP